MEDAPYRTNVRVETDEPAPLPRFLTVPIETLVEEHRQDYEQHRRVPGWWQRHVETELLDLEDRTRPGWFNPIGLPLYWAAVAAFILALPEADERQKSAIIAGFSLTWVTYVGLWLAMSSTLLNHSKTEANWGRAVFSYLLFPPTSAWFWLKTLVAQLRWKRSGGRWTLVPWREGEAINDVIAAFCAVETNPRGIALDLERERQASLLGEQKAVRKREEGFRKEAAAAEKAGQDQLASHFRASAKLEADRQRDLARQISQLQETLETGDRHLANLRRFLDQYRLLAQSRAKLRETGSLDPADTSDANLRALMQEQYLALKQTLEQGKEDDRTRPLSGPTEQEPAQADRTSGARRRTG